MDYSQILDKAQLTEAQKNLMLELLSSAAASSRNQSDSSAKKAENVVGQSASSEASPSKTKKQKTLENFFTKDKCRTTTAKDNEKFNSPKYTLDSSTTKDKLKSPRSEHKLNSPQAMKTDMVEDTLNNSPKAIDILKSPKGKLNSFTKSTAKDMLNNPKPEDKLNIPKAINKLIAPKVKSKLNSLKGADKSNTLKAIDVKLNSPKGNLNSPKALDVKLNSPKGKLNSPKATDDRLKSPKFKLNSPKAIDDKLNSPKFKLNSPKAIDDKLNSPKGKLNSPKAKEKLDNSEIIADRMELCYMDTCKNEQIARPESLNSSGSLSKPEHFLSPNSEKQCASSTKTKRTLSDTEIIEQMCNGNAMVVLERVDPKDYGIEVNSIKHISIRKHVKSKKSCNKSPMTKNEHSYPIDVNVTIDNSSQEEQLLSDSTELEQDNLPQKESNESSGSKRKPNIRAVQKKTSTSNLGLSKNILTHSTDALELFSANKNGEGLIVSPTTGESTTSQEQQFVSETCKLLSPPTKKTSNIQKETVCQNVVGGKCPEIVVKDKKGIAHKRKRSSVEDIELQVVLDTDDSLPPARKKTRRIITKKEVTGMTPETNKIENRSECNENFDNKIRKNSLSAVVAMDDKGENQSELAHLNSPLGRKIPRKESTVTERKNDETPDENVEHFSIDESKILEGDSSQVEQSEELSKGLNTSVKRVANKRGVRKKSPRIKRTPEKRNESIGNDNLITSNNIQVEDKVSCPDEQSESDSTELRKPKKRSAKEKSPTIKITQTKNPQQNILNKNDTVCLTDANIVKDKVSSQDEHLEFLSTDIIPPIGKKPQKQIGKKDLTFITRTAKVSKTQIKNLETSFNEELVDNDKNCLANEDTINKEGSSEMLDSTNLFLAPNKKQRKLKTLKGSTEIDEDKNLDNNETLVNVEKVKNSIPIENLSILLATEQDISADVVEISTAKLSTTPNRRQSKRNVKNKIEPMKSELVPAAIKCEELCNASVNNNSGITEELVNMNGCVTGPVEMNNADAPHFLLDTSPSTAPKKRTCRTLKKSHIVTKVSANQSNNDMQFPAEILDGNSSQDTNAIPIWSSCIIEEEVLKSPLCSQQTPGLKTHFKMKLVHIPQTVKSQTPEEQSKSSTKSASKKSKKPQITRLTAETPKETDVSLAEISPDVLLNENVTESDLHTIESLEAHESTPGDCAEAAASTDDPEESKDYDAFCCFQKVCSSLGITPEDLFRNQKLVKKLNTKPKKVLDPLLFLQAHKLVNGNTVTSLHIHDSKKQLEETLHKLINKS